MLYAERVQHSARFQRLRDAALKLVVPEPRFLQARRMAYLTWNGAAQQVVLQRDEVQHRVDKQSGGDHAVERVVLDAERNQLLATAERGLRTQSPFGTC